MKKISVTLIILCFTLCTTAQTNWQWAKSGGSLISYVGLNHIEEEIISMTTDPNGNLYAVAKVAGKTYVGGDSIVFYNTGVASGGFVVMSWACDGRLRWKKSTGANRISHIVADTLGGVYMMGVMQIASGNYFDRDTVIPAQNVLKDNFIIKYDTSGRLKWLRTPDPDTITAWGYYNRPRFSHLLATPGGELHLLAYLPVGTHADGAYPVTRAGYFILKYNKDGQFLSGTRMAFMPPYDINGEIIASTIDFAEFNRDAKNGRYYLCGTVYNSIYPTDHIYIGNDTLRCSNNIRSFAASFDASGNVKWLRAQDTVDKGTISRIATDNKGNLYISGQIFNGSRWNGARATAPMPSWGTVGMSMTLPYVASIDSNGAHKWLSVGYDTTDVGYGMPLSIAISRNNELRVAGSMAKNINWDNFRLQAAAPQSCVMGGLVYSKSGNFVARLDPVTGRCLALDSLRIEKCGNGISAQAVATDKNGNFYFGGRLTNVSGGRDTFLTIGRDRLISVGGTTDFFVCKYGAANCWPTSISTAKTSSLEGVSVYPNPAADKIYISGNTTPLDYELYNNTGSRTMSGQIAGSASGINISILPPGFYYIQLQDKSGVKSVFKIIKQ